MPLSQEAVPKKKRFSLIAVLVLPFVLLVGCVVMPDRFAKEEFKPVAQDVSGFEQGIGDNEKTVSLSLKETEPPQTMVVEQVDYLETYLATWPKELAVDSSKFLPKALPQLVASPSAKSENIEVVTDEIIISEIPPRSVEMVEQEDEVVDELAGPEPAMPVAEVRKEVELSPVSVAEGSQLLESESSLLIAEEGVVEEIIDGEPAPHRIGLKSVDRRGLATRRAYPGVGQQRGLAYRVPGNEKSGD